MSSPEPASIEVLRERVRAALEQRDAEAAAAIAHELDAQPALAAALQPDFDRALAAQPDALYAFVRARLAEDAPAVDPAWRERLHQAAQAALSIAISEGDPETIGDWLRLIAREPAAYGLGEVLQAGLIDALPAAAGDPGLALALLQLALRRDAAALERALADGRLLPQIDREGRTTLLAAALRDRRDACWLALAAQLCQSPEFSTLLAAAFQRSARPPGDVLALTAQLSASGRLSAQQSLDCDLALIDAQRWSPEVLPLMAQTARLVQNPAISVNGLVPWKLLSVAESQRDEMIARCAARRVMAQIEGSSDDEALIDALAQLRRALEWSAGAGAALGVWWRGFAQTLSGGRLSRLERALEARRELGEALAVVRSILAVRRLFARRSPEEMLQAVAGAHALLQTLDEAFGAPGRRGGYDASTLHAELDAHFASTPADTPRLLANSLRALALLIGEMGDERTKTPALRRAEDVDHQLASGELDPHGAVDALKWIAGYLEGSQRES